MVELSVIIPIRNRKKYLMKSLKYLLNQTIDNYEIIIIDYGGTDNLKKDLPKDLRIRYFYYNANKWSRSIPLNIGIMKAKGDLILPMDADMIIDENLFSEILKLKDKLEKNVLMFSFKREKGKSNYAYGIICYKKKYFLNINGYDERFFGWGLEDEDFYRRLRMFNDLGKIHRPDLILTHMKHDNEMRSLPSNEEYNKKYKLYKEIEDMYNGKIEIDKKRLVVGKK